MSGTAPAWQVREMQQQHFVRRLCTESLRIDSDQDTPYLFLADVAQVLLDYLRAELRGVPWSLDPDTTHTEAELFVEVTVLPRTLRFARTANERGMVLSKFLREILDGSVGQFQSRWQSEALHDPVTTLGTKGRMDPVSIA